VRSDRPARFRRQIERLLDEAEEAMRRLDWSTVRDRGEAVLALEPENADALAYRSAAQEKLAAMPRFAARYRSMRSALPGARKTLMGFALIGVVGLAAIGQYNLNSGPAALGTGIWFYIAAAGLFLFLVIFTEPRGVRLRQVGARAVARMIAVIGSMLLALVVVRLLQTKGPGGSHWDTLVVWAASALLYVGAFTAWSSWRSWPTRWRIPLAGVWPDLSLPIRAREILALGLVALVAVLARFVALGAVPDIVSGDEGVIGLLGLSALRGEISHPFATTYGHSTMFLFVLAMPLAILGDNPLGLRVLFALAGSLTVFPTWALARMMFGPRVALLAAAMLAVSHVHIHFSRIIVAGGILDALLTTSALCFFWRGLHARSTFSFVASGAIVAFHLYMYMGGRLTILFLVAYITVLYLIHPWLARRNSFNFIAFMGAFLLIGLPMFLWAVERPSDFMARINQIGIFQSGWIEQVSLSSGQPKWVILLDQLRHALLLFQVYPATSFYRAHIPMLDYFTAISFTLGMVYAIRYVIDPRMLLLHAWFWSAVIGGNVLLLSPGDAVHRVLILLPAAFILAAIGFDKVMSVAERLSIPRTKLLVSGFALVYVVTIGVVNVRYYFAEFSTSCRLEDLRTRQSSIMGQYIRSLPPGANIYLFNAPGLVYGIHRSVDFLSGRRPVDNVEQPVPDTRTRTPVDPRYGAAFVFPAERVAESVPIREAYPQGQWVELADCGKPVLWVLRVPEVGAHG